MTIVLKKFQNDGTPNIYFITLALSKQAYVHNTILKRELRTKNVVKLAKTPPILIFDDESILGQQYFFLFFREHNQALFPGIRATAGCHCNLHKKISPSRQKQPLLSKDWEPAVSLSAPLSSKVAAFGFGLRWYGQATESA